MTTVNETLGLSVRLNMGFDEAIEKVTEELKGQGFGVLTTIDVKATLKAKIDVDYKRYTILGACNPKIAYGALQVAEEVGLLLPCNVTVIESEEGVIDVTIINPLSMTLMLDNEDLKCVVEEGYDRLTKVANALRGEG